MGKDDPKYSQPEPAGQDAGRRRRLPSRRLMILIAALGLTGVLVACVARLPEEATPGGGSDAVETPLFQNWPRPDFVLLLSGQSNGFLQPCGCSEPQKGGYERRYNFVQTLKARGWPVVAADLGDVIAHDGPQKLLKYQVAMTAMKLIGYTAVGVGLREIEASVYDVVGQYALNDPVPALVAANLHEKPPTGCILPSAISNGSQAGPKVAFVGLIGKSVVPQVKDPSITFDPNNATVLKGLVQKLQVQKPELLVLLFHGTLAEAKACATMFPEFRIIVCSSEDEEPPSTPDQVGDTLIVRLGHKSRYVGVVGVNRTGQQNRPLDLRYQLVALNPEFDTPLAQQQNHPIIKLMESYAEEVKKGNYLAKYAQRPHPLQVQFPGAEYVGTGTCKECHESEYKVWKNSKHSVAYATLEKAPKHPLAQFDGECVACHTVGFGYKTGYTDEVRTKHLRNVGCEDCHGPGSLHVDDVKTKGKVTNWAVLKAMNEFKGKGDLPQADVGLFGACQKCHDIDNDVNFKSARFGWYWKQIAHPMPASERAAAGGQAEKK
jgi:hypothetical protein